MLIERKISTAPVVAWPISSSVSSLFVRCRFSILEIPLKKISLVVRTILAPSCLKTKRDMTHYRPFEINRSTTRTKLVVKQQRIKVLVHRYDEMTPLQPRRADEREQQAPFLYKDVYRQGNPSYPLPTRRNHYSNVPDSRPK
jgi:hypothetical protein